MQVALGRLDFDEAEPIPSTAALLAAGGDDRIALNAAGRNAYGCRPTAEAGVIAFGSSTASTISTAGFAAADRMRGDVAAQLRSASAAVVYAAEVQRLRQTLVSLLGLKDLPGLQTVLAASGTDLHRLAAQLIARGTARPLLSVISEAAETGGGVPAALAGEAGEVIQVRARAPDGALRDPAEVEAEVEALVETAVAQGRRVLLVVADVSKTGLITPGLGCVLALRRRRRHQVDVLVDACQFRLSPATLRAYLRHGLMVAATGSKFLGGPSFAGVLFVPAEVAERLQEYALPAGPETPSSRADWPAHWAAAATLPARPNFGLLLRWSAAVEHLRAFSALPPDRIAAFLARFRDAVEDEVWRRRGLQLIAAAPLDRSALGIAAGWDARPTIFAFALRKAAGRLLGPVEAALVYQLLRTNLAADWPGADAFGPDSSMRIELGQPVTFGRPGGDPAAALRLCVSAPMIVEALSGEAAADRILDRARCALARAAWAADQI